MSRPDVGSSSRITSDKKIGISLIIDKQAIRLEIIANRGIIASYFNFLAATQKLACYRSCFSTRNWHKQTVVPEVKDINLKLSENKLQYIIYPFMKI